MIYKTLKVKDTDDCISIDTDRLTNVSDRWFDTTAGIQVRGIKEFAGVGFFLAREYDWVLGKDSIGNVVLLPLKKEK